MGPLLRDAAEAGDLLGACSRAGVGVVEYHRARRADLAFDLACMEVDAAMRLATLAALEAHAAAGDVRAIKLLTQVEPQLRARAEALRADAPGHDAGPATTYSGHDDDGTPRYARVAGVAGGWAAAIAAGWEVGHGPCGRVQVLAEPGAATPAALSALSEVLAEAEMAAEDGEPVTTDGLLLRFQRGAVCAHCAVKVYPKAVAPPPPDESPIRPLFACPKCDWKQGPAEVMAHDGRGSSCMRCGYYMEI